MGVFSENAIIGASAAGGYDIDQSLRFNDDDSAFLQKAYASSGNRKTWTWSGWVKRCELGSATPNAIFSSDTGPQVGALEFPADDTFTFYDYTIGGSYQSRLVTTALYRDTATWYHIVVAYDTTQATSSNRIKIYINGSQVTDFSTETYPSQDLDGYINYGNNSRLHGLGKNTGLGDYLDGYLAEVHFIDGTALDASSFGETDSATNRWKPIEYTGSHGTNGFYMDFSDSSSLGTDSSGSGNNYTPSNLAATDQVLDSPTNNFCTLNPLNLVTNTTLSEGNLKADCTSSNDGAALGTMAVSSGKWYWEVLQTTANANNDISMGVMELSRKMAPQGVGADVYPNAYLYGNDGWNAKYNSTTSTINTYGAGDIIGWALDLDGNTLKIYKNNSLEYTYSSGVSGTFTPLAAVDGTSGQSVTHIANFGQDSSFNGEKTAQGNGGDGEDFYYTPPTGFKALNTSNLPDPSIADPTAHFNTVTYSGNSSTQAITGVGHQPDFTWIKARNQSYGHDLIDVVRGVNKAIGSNTSSTESGFGANYTIDSFDSDGFTLHNATYNNASGTNYVAWNWKAGGTAVSNTDGTITSSVSANTTAGFSIVSYTGTGTNAQSIGHGLSETPEIIFVKNRDSATNWTAMPGGSVLLGGSYYLELNQTSAKISNSNMFSSYANSTRFYTGTNSQTNTNGDDYIAYCFHSVEGYSKIGTYNGNNNADGAFIYTGFRPAFVIFKSTNDTFNWTMFDTKRNPYNAATKGFWADTNGTDTAQGYVVDFVSNGIKHRETNAYFNANLNYMYIAFAESPFKTANAR